jgi:hypothetical protein
MKRVAILQSSYIPWKGYFDLINSVDEFVFYDDMQYTRRDWRNRNKIKTPQGSKWLTIPVEVKGKYFQRINETKIAEADWPKRHWATIKQFYGRSRYFQDYAEQIEEEFLGTTETNLSLVNFKFINLVNSILGINTRMRWSSEFDLVVGKSERLLSLCKELKADVYLSGPSAKDYLDESLFSAEGVQVEWMSYSGYPKYAQPYPPFEHGVTIFDLIFSEGPHVKKYMKSFV